MTTQGNQFQQVHDETAEFGETEETMHAMQQSAMDAYIANRLNGFEVIPPNEANFPYRMIVELINEGAVTLVTDGTISYCNPRFGEMVQRECEKLIGTPFRELISLKDQSAFNAVLAQTRQEGARGEFRLKRADGTYIPVQLSIYQPGPDNGNGISIIVSDMGERLQFEAQIRALASKLTQAEQQERHRISQVLHDDLQQRLFAINAQLSFLKDIHLTNQVSTGVSSDLDQIQASLSEAIAITRNLSIDLNPIVSQEEGLIEAITRLLFQMQKQYGLHVELEAKENFDQLDNHMRTLLFQSIRELLFNVVKHAGTLQARVTLERVDGASRITVSDTGKGFDVEAVMNDPTVAHSLLIIRDRLKLLGCRMEILSKPRDGTLVLIENPLEMTST